MSFIMKYDLATQNQCLTLIAIENKNIMAVTLPLYPKCLLV